MSKKLKITRVRSDIGRPAGQRKTLQHLGLRKTGQAVVREDSPSLQGMLGKVSHLIKVEEVASGE